MRVGVVQDIVALLSTPVQSESILQVFPRLAQWIHAETHYADPDDSEQRCREWVLAYAIEAVRTWVGFQACRCGFMLFSRLTLAVSSFLSLGRGRVR